MDPASDAAVRLRAEHDALAERLGVRRSVDHVKEGGVLAFFTVIAGGMSAKLAWDRWGWLPRRAPIPPDGLPLWFLAALLVALLLLLFTVRAFRIARLYRAEEDALFARLLDLRRALGLDR